jgi:2-phosphoglycerate kinase
LNIYYIGGSPCCGKSTVAEKMAKTFGFYYFKVDDLLNEYMIRGTAAGNPFLAKMAAMSPEETWMRNPKIQKEEELEYYRQVYGFVCRDLERIQTADGIITEGAAYLPELMKQSGVDCRHYLCMTPTRDFQVLHYRERDWIPYILEGCSDREKAFQNWMERDALFAEDVKRSAGELGYRTLLIDGSAGEDDIFREVCRIFGL